MVINDSNLRCSTRVRKPNLKYVSMARTVQWFDEDLDLAKSCAMEAHPVTMKPPTVALSSEPAPKTIHDILNMPVGPVCNGWLKSAKTELKTLLDAHIFILDSIRDDKVSTPVMEIFKEKINSDGTLDKLETQIVVCGDLQGKVTTEYKWSPTASF